MAGNNTRDKVKAVTNPGKDGEGRMTVEEARRWATEVTGSKADGDLFVQGIPANKFSSSSLYGMLLDIGMGARSAKKLYRALMGPCIKFAHDASTEDGSDDEGSEGEKQDGQEGDQGVHAICTVCHNNFSKVERLVTLPCEGAHSFHLDCILPWLAGKGTCPNCREIVMVNGKMKRA